MKWLKRLFGNSGNDNSTESIDDTNSQPPAATWLEADSTENPFKCRVVSLMCNLEFTSFSKDERAATKAMSWRPGQQRLIRPKRNGDGIPCELRYPTIGKLPEGMLFLPEAMEDKWVISFNEGFVNFSRSWTGETEITAEASASVNQLSLSRIYCSANVLDSFGDIVSVIDWMMRSHAMNERALLPVDTATAELLFQSPVLGMNSFGHRLFAAGVDYKMPAPKGRLHSDGDMAAAVYENDAETVKRLGTEIAWKTPTRAGGAPPLVLASQLGYTDLCRQMLEQGAEIEAVNDRGGSALQMGIVGKHGIDHAKMLLDSGAELNSSNDDGFTTVHAAVEVDDAEMVRFLATKGADLEAQTHAGYRPIHIAAGLGHRDSAEALIEQGVDLEAKAEGLRPLEISTQEGKTKFAKWFADLR